MARGKRLPFLCWSVALLGAGASAQNTWTVDAKGRPGHQFTDLTQAIDAARAGDRIEVRDGRYPVLEINKGVDIVGLTDTVILEAVGSLEPIRASIPRGEFLRLERVQFGVNLWGWGGTGRLVISDCTGGVHLHRVRNFMTTEVVRSRNVTVTDSELHGSISDTALMIDASSFISVESSIVAAGGPIPFTGASSTAGAPGVVLHGELLATGSTISGSAGGSYQTEWFCRVFLASGPGITGSGRALLTGGCEVLGGPARSQNDLVCFSYSPAGPAIALGDLKELRITVDCALSPPDANYAVFRIPDVPTLSLPPEVDRGATLQMELSGPPDTAFAVFASDRHDALAVPGIDVPILLWLPGVAQVATLASDPAGRVVWTLTVPNLPRLQDRMIYSQAVVLRGVQMRGSLSNVDAMRIR